MGIEHIIRDLEGDAKAEAAAIISDARKEAAGIASQAKADAAELERAENARAKKDAERIMRLSGLAKIDAERARSLIEMELYVQVARKVRERLGSAHRDKKAYERYIQKAVEQGKALVGDDYVIYANKRDASVAKKFGRLAKTAIDCDGGVIVASADGRIRADSTFGAAFSEREQEVVNEARRMIKK
jgi:vacuolar-type H+-ATPase subunit E/Vma4